MKKYIQTSFLSIFIFLITPFLAPNLYGSSDANAAASCSGTVLVEAAQCSKYASTAAESTADAICSSSAAAYRAFTDLNGSSYYVCRVMGASKPCAVGVADVATTKVLNGANCTLFSRSECPIEFGCIKLQSDANNNALSKTVCNVLRVAQGTGGKAFAAIAVISVGIGFFTGKVSWGLMISVAAGIAALFGAPSIVAALGGGDSGCEELDTRI